MSKTKMLRETWLICGGRNFADQTLFDRSMALLVDRHGMPDRIVHGGARGADAMADAWARRHLVDCASVPAEWNIRGRSAGPRRNQKMLDDYSPTKVIAFPGGRGTHDMTERAWKNNIDVIQVVNEPSAAAER